MGDKNKNKWKKEKKEFRKRLGEVKIMEKSIEEEFKEMKDRVKEILKKDNETKQEKYKVGSGWWDKECKEKKERKKRIKKWRKGDGCREACKEEKMKYKRLLKMKRKEESKKLEKEIQKVKTKSQV